MINKYNTKFTALLNRRLKKVADNAWEYRACTLRNWWRFQGRR